MATLLAQLGPDERVDHLVGQLGADDDPDHPDGGVLTPGDLLRADEPLDHAQGRAHGHGEGDQGQHGEERHLGGRAGDPVAQGGVEHVGPELPGVVAEDPLGAAPGPGQDLVPGRDPLRRGSHRLTPRCSTD
jgi:hypothetical protein